MDLGLKDRVAIVTGGSRGIGRAACAEFLAEGARVVLCSRDPAANVAAVAELAGGDRLLGVPADLEREEDVRALVDKTLAAFGRIDILVNSAAAILPEDFMAMSDERFRAIFENKLNGTARCIRHVVPEMRRRNWGRIVNLSGGAGRQPQAARIAVALNNSAVLTLTKALATELAKDNILVNALIPQSIETARLAQTIGAGTAAANQRHARIPLQRMGRPEEVAAVIAFLASDRASFVTGAALNIDGGAASTI